MFAIHLPTLLLASAIVAGALVLLVLSTRVGLGPRARGIRTWLAGDLLLLLGQWVSVGAASLGVSGGSVVAIRGGMLTAGIALHIVAIHRHRHAPSRDDLAWLASGPLLGGGLALASAGMPSLVAQSAVFNALLIVLIGFNLARNLWPERRFLGVRMMMATQAFAVASNVAMLVSALVAPETLRHQATVAMLFGIVMTVLTSSSFVFWLQEELRESLERLAQTDALTGVWNRHGLVPLLARELARARRHGRPLSLAVCDVDHFKRINDRLGHAGGDAALRAFAAALQGGLRSADLVGRWGGEEFLVVLPETDAAGAARMLERVRSRPPGAPLDAHGRITFSAGIACTTEPGGFETADALIDRADARLYAAKVPRNAVVWNDGPARTSDAPGAVAPAA